MDPSALKRLHILQALFEAIPVVDYNTITGIMLDTILDIHNNCEYNNFRTESG
jgi:hypothetical protein